MHLLTVHKSTTPMAPTMEMTPVTVMPVTFGVPCPTPVFLTANYSATPMGTTALMPVSVFPVTYGTGLPVILFSSTVYKSTTPMAPTTDPMPVTVMPVTYGTQPSSFVSLTANH
jgi:hypothetical protein